MSSPATWSSPGERLRDELTLACCEPTELGAGGSAPAEAQCLIRCTGVPQLVTEIRCRF